MHFALLDLVVFTGALWLLVPFAIVMPGMLAAQIKGAQNATPLPGPMALGRKKVNVTRFCRLCGILPERGMLTGTQFAKNAVSDSLHHFITHPISLPKQLLQTMKIKPSTHLGKLAAFAALPLLASTSGLLAQNSTWVGNGTSGSPAAWSTGSNWTGTVPTSSSTVTLRFENTAANSWSNNDLTGLIVSSITIPASVSAINVKDNTVTGNAITLNGGFTVNTGNWQTFGFDMAMSAIRTFDITNGQLTLSGNLSGAGGITKSGGATLILNGTNSISNSTRLTINSGVVHLDSASALGAAASGTNGTISIGGGSTLSIRSNSAINAYALGGGSTGTSSTVTLGRQSAGSGYTQNFTVGDFGSRSMIFNTGANVSSGQMIANIGELRMTAGNNDRPVLLGGNATIQVGNASITNNGLLKRLQLDGTSANNTIGVISNTNNAVSGSVVAVVKDNSSTWTMTANNTYTGNTTITAGTLLVQSGARIHGTSEILVNGGNFIVNGSTGSGAVTVGAAGTLGGNGTIGGATVVNGSLNPGNSPGILTVANNLTFNGTTTMEVNGISTRGTDFDGVDVTSGGVMTFGGALVFSFGNISALSNTTDINLFSFAGTSLGNFSGVTSTGFYAGTWVVGEANNTWTLTSGGQTLTFSEVTGSLTVIPEPSTLALVGLAGLVGFLRSRRFAKRS